MIDSISGYLAVERLIEEKNAASPNQSKLNQSSFFSDAPIVNEHTSSSRSLQQVVYAPQQPQPVKELVPFKEEEEEGSQSKSNLETYSIYHFNKILSSDSYTLGKKVSVFLKDFLSRYRNIEESANTLPAPVRYSHDAIDAIAREYYANDQ
jgi:hypothetical protein